MKTYEVDSHASKALHLSVVAATTLIILILILALSACDESFDDPVDALDANFLTGTGEQESNVSSIFGSGHAIFVSNSSIVYEGPNPATRRTKDPAEVNNAPDVSLLMADFPTGKEILLLKAQDDPEAVLRFFVALKADANERSFAAKSLRSLPDAARAGEITQRKQSILAKQDRVALAIQKLGGTVLSRRWLVDGLVVEASGLAVDQILALREVEDASISEGEIQNEVMAGYDGIDIRSMLDTASFENAHYAADGGGRAGGNIRVGFIDLEKIACQHVGWLDSENGPSRLLRTYLCSSWYGVCFSSSSYCTQDASHATEVASIAVGSIEQQQDPSYPGFWTSEQKRRSGIASEADVYQYTLLRWPLVNDACDLVTAVEQAVADGVDVLNMSVGFGYPYCGLTENKCGLNEAFAAALNGGVLMVKSAGNEPYKGTCNVTYPAQQPTILAVSGVKNDNFNPPPIPYHETLKNGAGAAGRIQLTALDFSLVEYPVVGLVAPMSHSYTPYSPTSYYGPDGKAGTSLAAPVVSGIAAVLKQALKANGYNTDDDARTLMANVLLAGDGFYGYPYNYSYYKSYDKVSTSTGYGRVHARFPNSPELGTSSGWGTQPGTLYPGQQLDIVVNNGNRIDANVLGLKWVVLTDWDNLPFPPKIKVRVVNTCPSGGGAPYTVATASSMSALRHMLRLNSYQVAGSCLRLEIEAVSVPTQGVGIHSAYYYYSSNIDGEN